MEEQGRALTDLTYEKNLKTLSLYPVAIDLNQDSSEFSKFIRLASSEEKQAVFTKVIEESNRYQMIIFEEAGEMTPEMFEYLNAT